MRLFLFQSFRGFAPGRRGTFVSAKVTKTIDAPSGFIGGEGRKPWKSGPTRRAQTRAARCEERPSAGRRRGNGPLVDLCVSLFCWIEGGGGVDYSISGSIGSFF